MSPKNDKEGFSNLEKKVLIGEGTFVSISLLATIVVAVIYVSSLNGRVEAHTNSIILVQKDVSDFKTNYLKQMEIYNRNVEELNTRLSRIEGKLSISR